MANSSPCISNDNLTAVALVSPTQVQKAIGIGPSTLYKWCREGRLTPIKFGRRCTRFRLSDVQALIEAHAKNGGAHE